MTFGIKIILILLCSIISMVYTTENECKICTENITDENCVLTNCGHKFCAKCLKDWQKKKKNTCPECREDLNCTSPVIKRIRANDIGGTKFILERKPDIINKKNEENETPLSIAVKEGREEIVNLLIQNGADLNIIDQQSGKTLITIALEKQFYLIALKLFEHGEMSEKEKLDVSYQFDMLCHAVKIGYLSMIHKLIDSLHGFVDADKDGILLSVAAYYGQIESAKFLLDRNPNSIEYEPDTKKYPYLSKYQQEFLPIICAISKGHIPMIKFLLDNGAKTEYHSSILSPMHAACENGGGNLEIVKLLMEKNKNLINKVSTSSREETPLMIAIRHENIPIVKFLLENKANILIRDKYWKTTLMYAVKYAKTENMEIIDLLIEENYGIIQEVDYKGDYALAIAVIKNKEFVISHFLKNLRQYFTSEMIDNALPKIKNKYIQQIFNQYRDESLMYAIKKHDMEKVKQILKKIPDALNQRIVGNLTPLMMASGCGFEDIVILLLEKNVNLNEKSTQGATALMAASELGKLPIVKRLMKKDSSAFTMIFDNGHSALSVAAHSGEMEVVNFFVNFKYEWITHKMLQVARENCKTKEIKEKLMNCKSIFESIESHNEKRVKHMINKNPSAILEENELGQTVLQVACKSKNDNILQVVLLMN